VKHFYPSTSSILAISILAIASGGRKILAAHRRLLSLIKFSVRKTR